ncbi:6965_t:CDS:2 [Scutellospora calospora]|uniref:6965_t:CDS:1 n=1 Tax=Scutellospora calospora TaxID=85575 RepID=A0ACA9KWJ5_9GLOM|nr:6965_t:CDS:2 [Scutellospora calospora]
MSKERTDTNKTCTGSAVYRTGDNEFNEYKFKAFFSDDSALIQDIQKTNISLIIGCFAFESNELYVIIAQNTLLNISTIEDKPSIYDLPISSAFGIFTAPIQDLSEPERNNAVFSLKREMYKNITSNQFLISILFAGELVTLPDSKKRENTSLIQNSADTSKISSLKNALNNIQGDIDYNIDTIIVSNDTAKEITPQVQIVGANIKGSNSNKLKCTKNIQETNPNPKRTLRSAKKTKTSILGNKTEETLSQFQNTEINMKPTKATKSNHTSKNIQRTLNVTPKNDEQTINVTSKNDEQTDIIDIDNDQLTDTADSIFELSDAY